MAFLCGPSGCHARGLPVEANMRVTVSLETFSPTWCVCCYILTRGWHSKSYLSWFLGCMNPLATGTQVVLAQWRFKWCQSRTTPFFVFSCTRFLPGNIFQTITTSGEGVVNFHRRVSLGAGGAEQWRVALMSSTRGSKGLEKLPWYEAAEDGPSLLSWRRD